MSGRQSERCKQWTPREHHPVMFQLGAGSHASRPLSTYCFKEQFCIERRSLFEHDVDGATEFLCDDGERFGFSVSAHQSLVVALGLFIAANVPTACGTRLPR